jgi:hypothetical protein
MNFNVAPYYDDYAEDKKFLRILFRPGYSLQARELTQAQTILQKQVQRIGDYIFQNKSRVIPGATTFAGCASIKLEPLEVDSGVNLDTFIRAVDGVTVVGETTGVRAVIILCEPSTSVGDPALLYINYLSEGFNGERIFAQNEILTFTVVPVKTVNDQNVEVESNPTYTNPISGEVTTASVGSYRVRIQNSSDYQEKATIAVLETGIFYVDGAFVKVNAQKISLAKYSNEPTCMVGLDIVETIVTPEEDSSLLDNATGAPNYTAPGAHRYKVELVLNKKEIGFESENFILLLTLRRGILEFSAKGTNLSYLETLLARRTYDESGDYTVRPFEIEVKEHRDSDQGSWTGITNYQVGDVVFYTNPTTNAINYYVCLDNGVSGTSAPTHSSGAVSDGGVRWRYTPEAKYDYGLYSDSEGGDTDKIAFGVKDGKAFVKGFEYETSGVRYIEAPKARDFARITNTGIPIGLGNLIDVIPFGVPDIDGYQIVDLFKVDTPPTTSQTLGTMTAAADGSGTATPNNAVAKLTYAIVHTQASATSITEYQVAKLLASNVTTTTFPVALNSFASSGGAANSYGTYLTTSRVGTARIRYMEGGQTLNGRATAKISLMDVQMNPGEDFRKVRVIGSPLSLGSTSAGGDAQCFRALVLPTTYNSTIVGQSTVATTGNNNVDLAGLGTKWISGSTLTAGDMVWFPNAPTQFFFVRDLQGSDRAAKVTTWSNFTLSGPLNRADCIYQLPEDFDSLFAMPKRDIYTIRGGETLQDNNTTYTTLEKYTASGDAGTTFVSINLSVPDPDQLQITTPNAFIVINNTTGEAMTVFDVTLTTSNTATIRLVASSGRAGAIGNLQNDSYTIYAPVLKRLINAKEKVKSLVSSTLNLTLQTTIELDIININKADIYRVLKVEMFPNVIFGNDISGLATGSGIDITSNYEFDNGQRDTHYDLGRLIKGKSVPFPTGPIRVTFEYFEHSSGDYFSADSYPDLLYEEIPNFFSKITGRTTSLRDVLDFRPRVNDGGTFDGGTASLTSLPQRLYGLQCDFAYYLPRKDKIVLSKTGGFNLIQGVSSDNPQLPQTPDDTMHLFDIEYKPYTYRANSSNIIIKPIDNRRFTMKDIAKLEKRISNLEQTVTLNALEKETAQFSIKDQDGLDRFKNGFIVDNFTGHRVGNVLDPDYECSIDIIERVLRPAFNTTGVDLYEVARTAQERNAAGYRIHEGNIVTLPYFTGVEFYYKNKNEIQSITNKGNNATAAERSRKEALIRENNDLIIMEQPYATEFTTITSLTQPAGTGVVALYPSTDSWVETNIPQELVINEGGTYDSVAAQADALGIDFGTIWNNWQVSSLGRPITTVSSASWRDAGGTWTSTTSVVTQQVNETGRGTQTSLNESVGLTEVKGRLTARQSISYIRSRPVVFVGSAMRAGTRVYGFCDETNVTDYCTQATRLFLATRRFNYAEVPYQFGATNTERQVFLTYNTDAIEAGSASNYERTFMGSLANELATFTSIFTTIFSGTQTQPTSLTISQSLNDTARALIAPNSEVTAFTKGEVIRGQTSGATAIVILHEQSTNATTGQPDGVLDTLHVINVRGSFRAGETILGTIRSTKLNGGVLTLQLRGSNHIEAAAPGVLVTTGTGRCAGVWHLTSGQVINNRASPRFLTGRRVFMLSDSTTNSPTGRTTYAEGVYAAVGIIDATQGGIIGVRNASIGSGPVQRNRSFIQQLSSTTTFTFQPDPPPAPEPAGGDGGGGGNDPLAQTFMVTAQDSSNPEGCFLTEVELFFESKDTTTPVVVEIRTTQSGFPTTTVLPFAQKVVYPADILTSRDASVGTVVRFPAPVHVKNDTLYALIVIAASTQHRLWCATLDRTDVSPARLGRVLKSPSLGSLFKSQNASTWTESPTQDLKCNIFRAVFNTTSGSTDLGGTTTTGNYLTLTAGDVLPASNAGRSTRFTSLALNPFRVKLGTSEIIVRHPNHGMSTGSFVSYRNVTGSDQFGFNNTDFNSETFTRNQFDIRTSTFVSTGNLVKHEVYKVYSHDLYSIRIYDGTAAKLATSSGQFGGDQIFATRNAQFTTLHPVLEVLNFQSTAVNAQVKTTSGRSPTGSETPYQKDDNWTNIVLNDNNYFNSQRVILNKQNEADLLDRASSFEMRVRLQSSTKFLSPVIDLDRAMAIVTQNRIDDPLTTKSINSNYFSATGGFDGTEIYNSEYDNKEGGVQMGYITRKLQFKNTSKLLKVQFAASIPSNCRVDKSTPTVTLPIKFQSGSRTSEHPAIIVQRSKISTSYPIGATAIEFQAVTNIVDGMYVYGPGIQEGTRVNGIAGLIVTIDKSLKATIPSSTSGSVYFFTAFDITQSNKTKQIDVGDYVTYSGAGSPIPSGTYVTSAPKNTYFTKKVGSYATGSFVQASADNPITLTNTTTGGIDPTTNNMTVFVDNLSDIKLGMYCYIKFYNSNDGTFGWSPATIRRVLRINLDAKSIVLEKLSAADEWSSIGFNSSFYFNQNNSIITFFNPVIKLNQAVTGLVEPTLSTRTPTNLLTFTSPPNAEVEVYAKTSNAGNATSSAALSFSSNEYNAVTNPYGVDSTNEIIYFPIAHNLNTGSAILYNAGSNTITNLRTGTVYYAVVVTTTSIKLATTYQNAIEIGRATLGFTPINITATTVQESHSFTDVNQKDQASIEDDLFFRILPDIVVSGDQSNYGGNNPTLTSRGQLTTTDNIEEFIDHSFTVDNLSSFNTAIIKIVMRSRNPAFVSRIKDLRIIATA